MTTWTLMRRRMLKSYIQSLELNFKKYFQTIFQVHKRYSNGDSEKFFCEIMLDRNVSIK